MKCRAGCHRANVNLFHRWRIYFLHPPSFARASLNLLPLLHLLLPILQSLLTKSEGNQAWDNDDKETALRIWVDRNDRSP